MCFRHPSENNKFCRSQELIILLRYTSQYLPTYIKFFLIPVSKKLNLSPSAYLLLYLLPSLTISFQMLQLTD